MVDIASISAFLNTLGVAVKYVQGSLNKIKDIAVREKVEELLNSIIPLQSMILSLQVENATYIKEIQNLEKKLREIEDWTKEITAYELKEVTPGVHLYIKKSESSHTGPIVYLCPKCFDIDHKKSILQCNQMGYYKCTNCKNRFPPETY
jgi:hypothetical protein